MPSGSYWPDMEFELTVGDTKLHQTDDPFDYLRNMKDKYYHVEEETSCRESLSNYICSVSKNGADHAVKNTLADKFKCEIRIDKKFPTDGWINQWMMNYAWPQLFHRIHKTKYDIIHLEVARTCITDLYMEAPMSYSLFFLNRHNDFTEKEMADPKLTIKKILKFGDAWFGYSEGQMGVSCLLTAYAVYYILIAKGDRYLFCGPEDNSGLASYMEYSNFVMKSMPTFSAFVEDCGITDSHLSTLAGIGGMGGINTLEMLEMYRSKHPVAASKTSW